jgi:hypothetical protein
MQVLVQGLLDDVCLPCNDERVVSRARIQREHVEWTYATVVCALTPAASAPSAKATVLNIILSFLNSFFPENECDSPVCDVMNSNGPKMSVENATLDDAGQK